ncbi:MAG: acyl--CoA ligase [Bacilli bacterium]|nr:acyl--CoA ligase [Bacilli bacterium]
MTKEDLLKLKEELSKLSDAEKRKRNMYLRGIATGEILGPPVGYPSIDKPWLKYYEKNVLDEDLPEKTIYEYLISKNESNLDDYAIEYFGNKMTYRELINKIDDCADAFVSYGIKKGDVVTICMPTTPEMVMIFYALAKIGAISNMIDLRKNIKEIEEYTSEVNSKMFISIDLIENKIKDIKKHLDIDNVVIISPYESFNPILKNILKIKDKILNHQRDNIDFIKWDDFIKHGKSNPYSSPVCYNKDMPVAIVHTGGTTGKSKGVVLSNDNINKCARQCEISGLDFKDRGTWLDIMPPFIVYGVGNGLHLPLTMGMKVILMPKFDPTKYDDILLKLKPNYMAGVPSHYGYLLKSKKLNGVDLSFIKTPIVGGDKMDYNLEKEVNKFLKDHNCKTKIIKGYGMSEVDAAVTVCVNNEANKLKSVGVPLSHTNIGIFNPETDEELSYNQDGEIRITGPNVMLGYHNNEKEEEKVLHNICGDKWVYSGDLGYFDKDGNLFVHGRYKDMIIRPDGFKVYPSAIEDVIMQHGFVSECKVVGCRDYNEIQGELPKAYILLKKHHDKDMQKKILQEIEQLCEDNLAEYSLPFEYEIKDSLPVTSIGKIDSLALKREYEEKHKPKVLLKK